MLIKCLFIQRTNQEPELLAAWDELSICENEVGWLKDCDDQLNAVKGEYESSAYVYISVPDKDIEDQLKRRVVTVAGTVYPSSSDTDTRGRHDDI